MRAAAQSAAAAGYEVIAADQFADRDLREICPEARPVKYPEGLLEFAMTVPPCAWMYTGGLENYPELVDTISQRHRLLGNDGNVLCKVRDVNLLEAFARNFGLRFPEMRSTIPDDDRQWLIKQRSSSGGLGVRTAQVNSTLRKGEYFQEWIDGRHGSAGFLAWGDEAIFYFASEQIVDFPSLGAPPFHYAGNLLSFAPGHRSIFNSIDFHGLANELTRRFGLRGLFGIDFISREGELWLLEINPRYPASTELYERDLSWSLVEEHAVVCNETRLPLVQIDERLQVPIEGKAILYAREDCYITDRMSDRLWAMRDELHLADLPVGGCSIAKGHPVLTIFARGNRRKETLRSLETKANQLRALGIP